MEKCELCNEETKEEVYTFPVPGVLTGPGMLAHPTCRQKSINSYKEAINKREQYK